MDSVVKWLFVLLWSGWATLVVPSVLLPFTIGAGLYAMYRLVSDW